MWLKNIFKNIILKVFLFQVIEILIIKYFYTSERHDRYLDIQTCQTNLLL